MILLEILSTMLLAAGALFIVSGAVGLLRFPDFYTRIHATGITDSAGAGLILCGLLLRTTTWEAGVRLLIIMLFLVVTGPTATHLLAHAARRDGVPVWRKGDSRR
ncbi:monovalent cation/H(+) antiporter subunit G [Nonomuraea sp. B5E05]|uniref:monovalent cation/H(+) antiporter subunit G n=1 Tax=Nonomuraea sp. B5E05 TaxID=3153569 RepID=UPI0032617F74